MDANDSSQSQLVEVGQSALSRGAWEEARSAFSRALHSDGHDAATLEIYVIADPEGNAEVLLGLADALWWLGEIREALDCFERAYAGFRQRPDPAQAVYVAIQLSLIYGSNLGNYTAATGWAARAERLVDDHALAPLRGWVLVVQAASSTEQHHHEAWARQALELGREFDDRDLELCALTQIGVALIDQGRVSEGIAFHDEALAGALAGEGQQLDTVVFTACVMMTSYSRCAQYQRMAQWIRAADRFVERYGCPYLSASCRTHYGEVLFVTGDWPRAEEELRAAIRLSASSLPAVQGKALARLAELRLAQGRVEEAEQLLAGFEDHEAAATVFARIHFVRNRFNLAAATIERWLNVIGEHRLESVVPLELLGEAEIGLGHIEQAAQRGEKICELGRASRCHVVIARGHRLLGRALAASSDPAAKQHLDAALHAFIDLDMPFEAARTRMSLAPVLSALNAEHAEAEAITALAMFKNLGATADAHATTAVLREIQSTARDDGKVAHASGLSQRELEVLQLVAKGMSDKEIAAKLFLSRHTVHRHIHSILTKLNVSSRTAAAAYAVQHDLL